MRKKNPFTGATPFRDRHGKLRYRFRYKGRTIGYLRGAYGSQEFQASYAQLKTKAEAPDIKSHEAEYGTIGWVIDQYLKSADYKRIGPAYSRSLRLEFERYRKEYGSDPIAQLEPWIVERLVAAKSDTPAAANKLLKLMRRLCKYAIFLGVIKTDPTYGIKGFKTNPDGFHTWTDAEIAQFEDHHKEINPKAVLAMKLILFTGAARADVIKLGWQNVSNGRIKYRRQKTGGEVDLPILPELDKTINQVPRDKLLFLTHTDGLGYKAETFGNWFRDRVREAKLTDCPPHGLRKAGATRLANAGATEFEIMAFLGHKTPDEAKTYTRQANRARLGDSGMEKLRNMAHPVTRLATSKNQHIDK